ncbi:bacterial regulatory helix-turn-helix, lysR family protein [Collimonas arenae]|uniref:Bacterial regulatory helix-turn-helix, lysR family protein n=1 Tax=Collimonas arenae TaxID=279058 RepID=A0A127QKP5_9BURK|nr:LysR substrate-binding domain-containing protein [Collimonas arenae]AMP00747.1 bacterial regulatory helix-turn-helix, lysR family protein [Collimonas arenae]AMP10639.1 bacterial regulatory helix-turn-helix, lysR family protein [Collimonas arenae]
MQDLNDLYFFASVVQQGGFTAAGRSLGIPKSRLSRRISELETRLGARLLQRNTRGISLTDLGNRYYQHCQVVIAAAEAAELAVTSSLAEPSGTVRVSCVVAIAQSEVTAALPAFLERYPKVNIDLMFTNRRVNLLEEGVDVAVRVRATDDEDPNLATRRLRAASGYLVASPELMARYPTPQHPRDLVKLPFLGAAEQDRRVHLPLDGPERERYELVAQPRLAVEDFPLRKRAALRNLGLTMLPTEYCSEELKQGTLVRVLPEWSMPIGHVQVVYPTQRGLLPAVRVFVDFLIEHLSKVQPAG